MKSIFISRDLPDHHPLRHAAQQAGYHLVARSLLQLQRRPFADLPDADWLFFYSLNGVRFFMEGIAENRQESHLIRYKMAALGPATGRAITDLGYEAHFCGTGDPDETARGFQETMHIGDTVAFVQAAHSRESIRQRLPQEVACQTFVVYDNAPDTTAAATLPPCEVLFFTSPLNVTAYLQARPIAPQQPCLAIGETTAAALRAAGAASVTVAPNPQIDLLGEWLQQTLGKMLP